MLENSFSKENTTFLSVVVRFVKGMLVAFIISLLLFVGISLILQFTDFPEKYVPICVTVTTILSLFAASLFSARSIGSGGWLYGFMIALFYSIVLIAVGSAIQGSFSFNPQWGFNTLIAVFSGVAGGVAGVNFRSK